MSGTTPTLKGRIIYLVRLFLLLAFATHLAAQSPLQTQLQHIAAAAHGTLAIACSLPGTALDCNLNPHAHPPMQSVFKLPVGLLILHQVEQGKLSLDQPIRFLPSDRFIPHAYSPLQDQYPQADVDIPLRELLRLTVALSDNAAADLLLRIAGGPSALTAYMHSLGVTGFHLQDGEHEIHRNHRHQYRNWFEPASAVTLLRLIADKSPLTPDHTQLVLTWMRTPGASQRIQSGLPAGTIVAHKSGTSDTDRGITAATNDTGLIPLPDGRTLALAIFLTNSTAPDDARDQTTAQAARTIYNAAVGAP